MLEVIKISVTCILTHVLASCIQTEQQAMSVTQSYTADVGSDQDISHMHSDTCTSFLHTNRTTSHVSNTIIHCRYWKGFLNKMSVIRALTLSAWKRDKIASYVSSTIDNTVRRTVLSMGALADS